MRTRIFFLSIAFTFTIINAQAQFTAGVKTNLIVNDTEVTSGAVDLDRTVKSMNGYSIGGHASYRLNQNWSLAGELLYKHIGFQIAESTSFGLFGLDIPIGATLKTKVNYLELPILFRYAHDLGTMSAYVEAGPSINYALNGHVETVANSILDFNVYKTDLNLSGESYNRINTTANIGAGLSYPYNEDITLSAGIRYSKDLSSSLELPILNAGIKNNSYSIGLSVGKNF